MTTPEEPDNLLGRIDKWLNHDTPLGVIPYFALIFYVVRAVVGQIFRDRKSLRRP